MPRMSGIKRHRARELRQDMTPEETRVWDHLRHHRLGHPHIRRRHILGGFIVDVYYHAARLIIAVDGAIHDHQQEADAERDAILFASGYGVLRITNDDIHSNLDAVLDRILAHCMPAE